MRILDCNETMVIVINVSCICVNWNIGTSNTNTDETVLQQKLTIFFLYNYFANKILVIFFFHCIFIFDIIFTMIIFNYRCGIITNNIVSIVCIIISQRVLKIKMVILFYVSVLFLIVVMIVKRNKNTGESDRIVLITTVGGITSDVKVESNIQASQIDVETVANDVKNQT